MTDVISSSLETDRFWSRIANELAHAIGQGVYAPGVRLPSEHLLAKQFGVNRHTIRRSIASLEQRGLVHAAQGRGTFVESFAVDLVLGKRTRHRHSLSHAGLRGGLTVLQSEVVEAGSDESQALCVNEGEKLLYLRVLGEGAGQALHVSDRFFPLPRFANLSEFVRSTGSISEAFAQHGVTDYLRKESRISARLPEKNVAEILTQSVSRPALLVTSVNVDTEGIPIEFSKAWFAGDRVTLTVNHHDS
jgi:GntR family phosphonate transport system transcriptional regulator